MDGRALLDVAGELAAGSNEAHWRSSVGRASYQLSLSGPFVSARIAIQALADAEAAVALLDALEADPARRTAAVGSIPP